MPLILALMVVSLCFGLGAWLGAPYLPVLSRDIEALLDLAKVGAGQTVVDLGSGDGKLLRAAARRGAIGIGYEINPIVYAISWLLCWPYRKRIKLYMRNYWQVPLPACDVVYVFLIDRYMSKLDAKILSETSKPVKLVSYVFKVPGRTPKYSSHNAYVYLYNN